MACSLLSHTLFCDFLFCIIRMAGLHHALLVKLQMWPLGYRHCETKTNGLTNLLWRYQHALTEGKINRKQICVAPTQDFSCSTSSSNQIYHGVCTGLVSDNALCSDVVILFKKYKNTWNKQPHNSSWCQPLLPSLQWGRGSCKMGLGFSL